MAVIGRSPFAPALHETRRSLRSSPVFVFYVLVTLAVAGYLGLMVGQMALGLDLFLPGLFGQMSHGQGVPHRMHDLTLALLMATTVVAMLAQLRRPSANVAGMAMALIPFAGLVIAAVLSDQLQIVQRNPYRLIAAVAAVAVLLHPSGRSFFRSFRLARLNWSMLALVGLAAVPLLSFASTNVGLQATVLDEHSVQGHYAFMAALAYTVVGLGLLASLRPNGWRLTAWVTGLLPAALGALSLLYAEASSSLDAGWALAAVAWGIAFVAVAERARNGERSTPPRSSTVGTVNADQPERATRHVTDARTAP